MKEKRVINNSFFDLIAFILSFFVSFFRSFKLFFGSGKKIKKNNIFFSFLDFVFRKWGEYFWEKPSIYKLSSFIGDILKSIFKNK